MDREDAILISEGRLFHNRGPTTENARSPLRLSLDFGLIISVLYLCIFIFIINVLYINDILVDSSYTHPGGLQ